MLLELITLLASLFLFFDWLIFILLEFVFHEEFLHDDHWARFLALYLHQFIVRKLIWVLLLGNLRILL